MRELKEEANMEAVLLFFEIYPSTVPDDTVHRPQKNMCSQDSDILTDMSNIWKTVLVGDP